MSALIYPHGTQALVGKKHVFFHQKKVVLKAFIFLGFSKSKNLFGSSAAIQVGKKSKTWASTTPLT